MSTIHLDPIDKAYETFSSLLPELKVNAESITTEQDTRLKIIDPIFITVLQWVPFNISTEDPTGDGFIDYKFSINGLSKLIVEAKKDSVSLGLANRSPARAYKLSGPVLSKSPQPRGGILQAIRYCGSKNAELACVTNGSEWIIFRGSRLGDGKDTLDGIAFIFPHLDSIKENFELFFDLLSTTAVENYVYRGYFQEAEGQPIRAKAFSKTLKPVDGYRLLEQSELSVDINSIMTTFFRRLSGVDEEEMLAKCFVVTKESQIADKQLIRIADELTVNIHNLDTNEGKALSQAIERVQQTQRNEFVLLIGTKGAGKSTFTERFFKFVLPDRIKNHSIVIRLNVGESPGNPATIIDWLNEHLLSLIEQKLFGEYGPKYEEIQGMYFDEYKRWLRGPHKFLYERDKGEFKEKFGEHIEKLRFEKPEEYIKRLIHHIVSSRRKVPCLVFDNTDHFSIEFQEIIFQYARSLYESELCLILIPITDKTSWQLSRQGALQSFDSESFFLPTPTPKIVLDKRISFLEEKLSTEKQEKKTGYFLERGIRLSLDDINAFVVCLQNVFLETGMVSKWIGNLANNDIRRCLHLTRDVVSSPYLRVDDLVKAYLAKASFQSSEINIKRAIIRKGYNFYPTGQNEFVQNLYSLTTEIETTPLLSLRILRLLRDAKHHDAGGLEDYVTVGQVLDYLQAIGIERRVTTLCLDALLKSGLCLSYDPTVTDISFVKKVQLSPSGLQHLVWGSWDETYIGSMLQVTPISDQEIHQKMVEVKARNDYQRWNARVVIFLQYLIDEDQVYTSDIDHPAYKGQGKLISALKIKIKRIR
ncbi:MAG: ATP-binding protein [Candidatus Electrothrix sp. AW2]|nr:ATP-binding protein [Candidatus Electrothrix gigas]